MTTKKDDPLRELYDEAMAGAQSYAPIGVQTKLGEKLMDIIGDAAQDIMETSFWEDIAIDRSNLQNEALEHPRILARYALMQAQASFQYDKAKRAREEAEARADMAFRQEAQAAQVKITEAMVKNEVALRTSDAAEVEIEAKRRRSVLWAALEAMRARGIALHGWKEVGRSESENEADEFFRKAGQEP